MSKNNADLRNSLSAQQPGKAISSGMEAYDEASRSCWPEHFDSAGVSSYVVGIPSIHLNNFLKKKHYGLKASQQEKNRVGSRRYFSREDVFGIALVWLLHESGLGRDAIGNVLRQITGSNNLDPNLAASKLQNIKEDLLLVIRRPPNNSEFGKGELEQVLILSDQVSVEEQLRANLGNPLVVIPFGKRFRDIYRRIEKINPNFYSRFVHTGPI